MKRVVMSLIAGAALIAIMQSGAGAGHPVGPMPASAAATGMSDDRMPGFSIHGSVSGLYPGASLPLVLTITNPQRYAIVVKSITTTVGSAGGGCGAAYLVVTPFSGQRTLPAKSSAKVTVTATLDHTAPNACQGALFGLTFAGMAAAK